MHDGTTSLRRAPWSSAEGDKPAWITSDGGPLNALADRLENDRLADAYTVLGHARASLALRLPYPELLGVAIRLTEALTLAADVAVMRGERLGTDGA